MERLLHTNDAPVNKAAGTRPGHVETTDSADMADLRLLLALSEIEKAKELASESDRNMNEGLDLIEVAFRQLRQAKMLAQSALARLEEETTKEDRNAK